MVPRTFFSSFCPAVSLAALLIFPCLSGVAQNAPTRLVIPGTFGDKVYENVRVLGATEQGLKIAHDGGLMLVPFKSLPEDWRAKYAPAAPTPAPMPTPAPSAAVLPGTTPASPGSTGTGATTFDPSCVVFIKTDSGAGSGFIARAAGKTYVYTNAHVLCGEPGAFTKKIVSIKTPTGKTIPTPYELELSDTYDPASPSGLEDLARFPITLKEGEPAYDIAELDVAGAMNQKVVAYGNSLGGDVITSLEGVILGLGTDRIEVSCEIVPGNSGGPVVLANTRKVVGISTYLASGERDIWAASTQFSGVRRFAMRPEKVTKWRKMLYTSLMSSLAELSAFDRDTLSLAAACFLNPRPNRAGFEVPGTRNGNYVIRDVLVEGAKYSLGGTITAGVTRVNQRLGGAAGTMSIAGVVPVFAEFFSSVSAASNSQMSAIAATDRAPYVKQFIPVLVGLRKRVQEQFVQEAGRFR